MHRIGGIDGVFRVVVEVGDHVLGDFVHRGHIIIRKIGYRLIHLGIAVGVYPYVVVLPEGQIDLAVIFQLNSVGIRGEGLAARAVSLGNGSFEQVELLVVQRAGRRHQLFQVDGLHGVAALIVIISQVGGNRAVLHHAYEYFPGEGDGQVFAIDVDVLCRLLNAPDIGGLGLKPRGHARARVIDVAFNRRVAVVVHDLERSIHLNIELIIMDGILRAVVADVNVKVNLLRIGAGGIPPII